jgi:hypothetical protein
MSCNNNKIIVDFPISRSKNVAVGGLRLEVGGKFIEVNN